MGPGKLQFWLLSGIRALLFEHLAAQVLKKVCRSFCPKSAVFPGIAQGGCTFFARVDCEDMSTFQDIPGPRPSTLSPMRASRCRRKPFKNRGASTSAASPGWRYDWDWCVSLPKRCQIPCVFGVQNHIFYGFWGTQVRIFT